MAVLQFQTFSPLSSWQEAWQPRDSYGAGRHCARRADISTFGSEGSQKEIVFFRQLREECHLCHLHWTELDPKICQSPPTQ